GEDLGAVAGPILLVGAEDEGHGSLFQVATGLGGRSDHGSDRPLHVGDSPAPQRVGDHDSPERVGLPVALSDRLGVEVAAQGEVAATGTEPDLDDEVGTLFRPHQPGGGKTETVAPGSDQLGGGPLVTSGVDAGHGNELRGELWDVDLPPGPFKI